MQMIQWVPRLLISLLMITSDSTINEGWLPIGSGNTDDGTDNEFNAIFEGNGYKIKNLYINRRYRTEQGSLVKLVGML